MKFCKNNSALNIPIDSLWTKILEFQANFVKKLANRNPFYRFIFGLINVCRLQVFVLHGIFFRINVMGERFKNTNWKEIINQKVKINWKSQINQKSRISKLRLFSKTSIQQNVFFQSFDFKVRSNRYRLHSTELHGSPKQIYFSTVRSQWRSRIRAVLVSNSFLPLRRN